MRFACQSCGKAYNLPEERIADKSNVKLKCRVCGAIVEVKRQGELVAHVLDDADDAKRMARVSEAPAPLTSISPDDDEADGQTVSISEASINERGPLELELPLMPPAAATGFGSSALSSAMSAGGMSLGEAGAGRMEVVNVAPPLPPPPLSPSSLPPPPPLRGLEAPTDVLTNGSHGVAANGSIASGNGSSAFFPVEAGATPEPGEAQELLAPVAQNAAAGSDALPADATAITSDVVDFPASPGEMPVKGHAFKLKMAAAFVTGVLIDRIVSGLFQ